MYLPSTCLYYALTLHTHTTGWGQASALEALFKDDEDDYAEPMPQRGEESDRVPMPGLVVKWPANGFKYHPGSSSDPYRYTRTDASAAPWGELDEEDRTHGHLATERLASEDDEGYFALAAPMWRDRAARARAREEMARREAEEEAKMAAMAQHMAKHERVTIGCVRVLLVSRVLTLCKRAPLNRRSGRQRMQHASAG